MKLTVDIPKERYEWIKEHKGVTDYQTTEMLYKRVRKAEEQRTGRWIYDDFLRVDKCSCCGAIKENYFFDDVHAPINFCPACGARMMEEQNDG